MKQVVVTYLLKSQQFLIKKLTTENIIFLSDIFVTLLSLYVTLRILLGKNLHFLHLKHCVVFSLIGFSLFSWIRSIQGKHRYITLEKISGILGCAVLANLLYHPLMLLMGGVPPLTPILNTFLFIVGLLLPRVLAPLWMRRVIKTHTIELVPKIPVLVIGYNQHIGAYLRRNCMKSAENSSFPYDVQGILLNKSLSEDDMDPLFSVLGNIKDFVSIIQKLSLEGREPKRLLIVQESLNNLSLRHILMKFQKQGILILCFEIAPTTHEVNLRPLHIEDLLGKANLDSCVSVQEDDSSSWQDIQSLVDSKRVLITGIQDSVLYHLTQYIVRFYPRHLLIVDPSEYVLAQLKVKFDQLYPDVICDYIVTSVTDHEIMDRLLEKYDPQIIIHGDQIMTPELMATNLKQAVQKNILSLVHFAKQVKRQKARLFVLVSPQTSTLLSQLITFMATQQIQKMDQLSSSEWPTRYLVIHRCDIWGGLDSSTPFWSEQLKEGLSINMSSPDAYSYIISAQEASRAILQAITRAFLHEDQKGQSFSLLGGEPLRFLDLLRSLCLLEGFIPEIDAKVHFSGNVLLRPAFGEEEMLHSLVPGVAKNMKNFEDLEENSSLLIHLSKLVEEADISKILVLLKEATQCSNNVSTIVSSKQEG